MKYQALLFMKMKKNISHTLSSATFVIAKLGSSACSIQKAQAESFIHIFVNNSPKLTEFLEHMISVSC